MYIAGEPGISCRGEVSGDPGISEPGNEILEVAGDMRGDPGRDCAVVMALLIEEQTDRTAGDVGWTEEKLADKEAC